MQQDLRGGPGGDDDRFILQVREIFDRAAFLHQQTGADDEDSIGEGRLFLALEVVGGRAALEIKGAILQQRNTILRGDRDQFDLQIGFVQFFLMASTMALE